MNHCQGTPSQPWPWESHRVPEDLSCWGPFWLQNPFPQHPSSAITFQMSICILQQCCDGRRGTAECLSCCRPDSWLRLQKMWHHVAEMTPCWALQEAKELVSTWGAGQRGAGAEFSQGRVGDDRGPQQDCQQPAGSGATWGQGQGTRGGRLWEGNVPSVCWAPAPPTPPAR